MKVLESAYDNTAFGGSVVNPLNKFDYKLIASVKKDKEQLKELEKAYKIMIQN